MSQSFRQQQPSFEDSSSAAFSFSIENSAASASTAASSTPPQPVDLVIPHPPSTRELLIPLGALLNLGLIQFGFYLGYFDTTHETLMYTLHLFSVGAGVFVAGLCGAQPFLKGVASLKKLRLTPEILFVTSLASLFVAAGTELVQASSPSAVWMIAESFGFAAALIALFYSLKEYAISRFVAGCTFIPDERSHTVHLLDAEADFAERDVSSSVVSVGSIIRVKAGETVPVDCSVINGLCEVLERKLSGESHYRVKGKGDTIYAGSTVQKNNADCKVLATADESYITSFLGVVYKNLSKIVALSEKNGETETKFQVGIVFIATVSAVFWYGNGKGLPFALTVFSSVLLIGIVPFTLTLASFLYRRALLSSFAHGILYRDFQGAITALQETDVLALDYGARSVHGQVAVESFELIDERVDRASLISVLISIFGRSDEEIHVSMTQFLRELVDSTTLYDVSNLELFEDANIPMHSIGALIEGIEFTIGSEELLIARGVQVQTSDVSEVRGAGSLYVAMQDEIVARIGYVTRFTDDAKQLVSEVKNLKIRPVVCSQNTFDEVLPIAQALGLDIPDTFSDLTTARFREKLDSLKPCALLANKATSREVLDAATVSLGLFDERKWDVHSTDVTLFSTDLSRVPWMLGMAVRLKNITKNNLFFTIAITGLLAVLAAAGAIEASVVALSTLIGCSYLYFHTTTAIEDLN